MPCSDTKIIVIATDKFPKFYIFYIIMGRFLLYMYIMEKLDNLDHKILTELQRDTDIALEALGERIGLSRNACWRRIKALESSGVIRKRVALLNAGKIGLGLCVFMQIRAAAHDASWLEKFARVTGNMPEIQGVYRMSGDLDYLIRACVADMADYDRLYQTLIARVPMGDVSASFVMEEIKDTAEFPLNHS